MGDFFFAGCWIHVFNRVSQHAERGLNDSGIEVCSSTACELITCPLVGVASLIGTISRHCLVRLRHPNDACCLWNILSDQPVGVACAVPVLVVVLYGWHQVVEEGAYFEDLCAQHGMPLDE